VRPCSRWGLFSPLNVLPPMRRFSRANLVDNIVESVDVKLKEDLRMPEHMPRTRPQCFIVALPANAHTCR